LTTFEYVEPLKEKGTHTRTNTPIEDIFAELVAQYHYIGGTAKAVL
jgi:hypothetical protein